MDILTIIHINVIDINNISIGVNTLIFNIYCIGENNILKIILSIKGNTIIKGGNHFGFFNLEYYCLISICEDILLKYI